MGYQSNPKSQRNLLPRRRKRLKRNPRKRKTPRRRRANLRMKKKPRRKTRKKLRRKKRKNPRKRRRKRIKFLTKGSSLRKSLKPWRKRLGRLSDGEMRRSPSRRPNLHLRCPN